MNQNPKLGHLPSVKYLFLGLFSSSRGTRKFYEINQGDFVEVNVLKYENNKRPRGGTFTARVGEHGSIFIPKALREIMGIKPGDIVEVLLLAHYKAKNSKQE